MPLVPSVMRTYALTLRPLDNDGVITEEEQEATAYLIQGYFHLFVNRGRIIRAILWNRVVEVRELETR